MILINPALQETNMKTQCSTKSAQWSLMTSSILEVTLLPRTTSSCKRIKLHILSTVQLIIAQTITWRREWSTSRCIWRTMFAKTLRAVSTTWLNSWVRQSKRVEEYMSIACKAFPDLQPCVFVIWYTPRRSALMTDLNLSGREDKSLIPTWHLWRN